MKLLRVNEKNRVVSVHYKPEELSNYNGGILVDSIPEPVQIEGKLSVLYCNPETKELWYETEDVPKTEEDILKEKLKTLEDENLVIKQSMAELAELMLGGM